MNILRVVVLIMLACSMECMAAETVLTTRKQNPSCVGSKKNPCSRVHIKVYTQEEIDKVLSKIEQENVDLKNGVLDALRRLQLAQLSSDLLTDLIHRLEEQERLQARVVLLESRIKELESAGKQ
jgi:hypothetical protein